MARTDTLAILFLLLFCLCVLINQETTLLQKRINAVESSMIQLLENQIKITKEIIHFQNRPINKPKKLIKASINHSTKNDILTYVNTYIPEKYSTSFYFKKHLSDRLPKYEILFKKAANQYNIDWRLLAAISYQESLWNPEAVSPTGVKGLMMLTKATAKEMNVTDRTDPKQSIFGGAGYFKKLHERLPKQIQEPNRTLMALASYNAGYGHLIDARTITKEQGGNYTDWKQVKKRLPLLQDKNYYKDLKYGFSPGARQALHYVGEVQFFYKLLLLATEEIEIEKTVAEQNNLPEAFQIALYQ